ncbi:uncharacterized protein DNG_06229 [Cephalotrichum gorgonifer]|uniref:Zn(2)-C6 fungal-type domain-containing protein n=1 Tax=Cephalotrichum gorgonifer TaxID=2041049 RepID=A0AAE8MZ95_9PEZI|nr:uncharacterized protein DNG_06229 [Cephalotrichum gorgonifer]
MSSLVNEDGRFVWKLSSYLQAGTNIKEKKKKCDEVRPQCQRCSDKRLECTYEAVKPRQRRRQSSREPLSPLSPYMQRPALDLAFPSFEEPLGSWDHNTTTSPVATQYPPIAEALAPVSAVPEASLLSPDVTTVLEQQQPTYHKPETTEDDDVEEIAVSTSTELTLAHPSRSRDVTAPYRNTQADFSLENSHFKFVVPLYAEFADLHRRRTLVDHFCNVLSRRIVLNEDSGNPFQRLVLPLCQRSEAVRNSVYALASAHREYGGLVTTNGENSAFFYNQAIQGITMLIGKGAKANRNELLAAIMLLVYYEVLVKDGTTNIVDGHLKGAMSVIAASNESPDDTAVFLERAFRFYEVISALSFGTAPLTTSTANDCAAPRPRAKTPTSRSGGDVDTLLGMASTLWPILHKLSTLLALKRKLESSSLEADPAGTAALQTEFANSAYGVDVALKEWKPNLPPQLYAVGKDEAEESCDPEARASASQRAHLQSVLNNALAYQHSAIVYLHRTIYGHSRSHALVQRHAHVALTHCVATVRNGGPMGALLWPLFVAACEAVTLGDRDLARQAFMAIGQRQGMLNIERAWFIIQEVWRRADTADEFAKASQVGGAGSGCGTLPIFKGRDLWRRVSEEMGVTIVLG